MESQVRDQICIVELPSKGFGEVASSRPVGDAAEDAAVDSPAARTTIFNMDLLGEKNAIVPHTTIKNGIKRNGDMHDETA